MSRNPLWIDPNSGSLAEQVRAIINVLNANTNEMYVGGMSSSLPEDV